MSGLLPMTEILPHRAEIREGDGRHPGFVLPPSRGSERSQPVVRGHVGRRQCLPDQDTVAS